MPKFALFLAIVRAMPAGAASLQDPMVTTAYYTSTYHSQAAVGLLQLHSLNNNNVAIGESIVNNVKPGFEPSLAVTYNIQTGEIQSADFDNDKQFQFSSLNDNGTYVGYGHLNDYTGGFTGSVSSFRLFGTPFSPLNVPGATSTFPNSINDSGTVVGGYISSVDGLEHGFIYRPDGTFQTVDDPALKGTTLVGINSSGQIVGYSSDGSLTGFLYSGGTLTQIGYGAPSAINDAGAIALNVSGNFGNAYGGILYPDGTLALTFSSGLGPGFVPIGGFSAINDQGVLIFNSAGAFIATPIAPEPGSLRLLLCAAAASGVAIGILRRRY